MFSYRCGRHDSCKIQLFIQYLNSSYANGVKLSQGSTTVLPAFKDKERAKQTAYKNTIFTQNTLWNCIHPVFFSIGIFAK